MKQKTKANAIMAGIWGLVSAFSLFIGALVGVSFKIPQRLNGQIMAFGAGALLFAVSIEMFAAGLRELEEGEDSFRMNVLVGSSVVGAVFYTLVNRCLTGGHGNSVSASAKKDANEASMREAADAAAGSSLRPLNDRHHLASSSGGGSTGPKKKQKKQKKSAGIGSMANSDDGELGESRSMLHRATNEKKSHMGDNDEDDDEEEQSSVAFSIWLGILIDGVPESMLIGFMQSEGQLSIAFVVAVFLANFPEAMSSSALMYRQGDSLVKILCMWSSLFLGTGLVAFLTALAFPGRCHRVDAGLLEAEPHSQECEFPGIVNFIASASEGLAGGSMMACISTAMLPEAYEEGGDFAGLYTLLGFLASLFVKLSLETHPHAQGTICSATCFHEMAHEYALGEEVGALVASHDTQHQHNSELLST